MIYFEIVSTEHFPVDIYRRTLMPDIVYDSPKQGINDWFDCQKLCFNTILASQVSCLETMING